MPNIQINIKKSAFNKKHYPLLDNQDRIVICWGGRDSGKSWDTALKLVIKCLRQPYFKCILVRKRYNWIKDSSYEQIKKCIYHHNLERLFHFKQSPLEITCKINGNKFIARGCDDTTKLKSIVEPTDAWYEEANQLSETDWLTISQTLRSSSVPVEEHFTLNPEPEGQVEEFWMYKRFFEGRTSNSFKEVVEVNAGDKVIKYGLTVVHSTYKDNNFIPDERIATLEEHKDHPDPYWYQVWTLGNWATKSVERRFFSLYDPKDHESHEAQFIPGKQIYVSMDFNMEPFAFIFSHVWYDGKGHHWHIFDEATISNANLDDGIELIRSKYGKYLHNIIITGDAMGKKRDFGQRDHANYYVRIRRGLGIRDSQIETFPNPTHENSRSDCNYVFVHYPDFKIHPINAKMTSLDLRTVAADNYGNLLKKDRKKLNQRADHADCVRYMVNHDIVKRWIDRHQLKTHRQKKVG